MVQQDHTNSLIVGLFIIGALAFAGQDKARHDIRYDDHTVTVNLFYLVCTTNTIGNGQHGIGMGMVNKFIWQDGM